MAPNTINIDQPGGIGKNVIKLIEKQTVAEFSFNSKWKAAIISTLFV